MKTLLLLFIPLFILSCGSPQTDAVSPIDVEHSEKDSSNEAAEILGHWKFVKNQIVNPAFLKEDPDAIAQEETYFYQPFTTDLVFSADSFYRIDYPTELCQRGAYEVDTFYLHMKGALGMSRYKIKTDTLILYRMDEGNLLKETYQKTNFNDSIVSILKRDGFDYALLEGTWLLLREYSYDYGTEYVLNFPHEIPDSIVLTRADILATLHTDRSVMMTTDEKKMTYTFSHDYGQLNLTPNSWYNGKSVTLEFMRNTEY